MKETICKYIKNQLANEAEISEHNAFTASDIRELFSIKRNTASKYLNELVKDGELIKINSRPVFFMDRKFVERILGTELLKSEFSSIKELVNKEEVKAYEGIIGKNASLEKVIQQLESASLYPTGLPVLLHGESGTGKSMLAKLTYEYCKETGILANSSPFITLNCAQYFHNPELLSSQLFGYKKGAFTGAETDTTGLIDAAEGGILFLDEVHRLSPEGQEKLFILMDQSKFSRVGETTVMHSANIRLIFATTEDIERNFLATFLRRIPIICKIPNFFERSYQERKQLIHLMFMKESKTLGISIKVSELVLKKLIYGKYKGNIGEVENIIKKVCASEYAIQNKKNPLDIRYFSLGNQLIEEPMEKTHSASFINESILFSPAMELRFSKELTFFNQLANNFFRNILKQYKEYKKVQIEFADFKEKLTNEVYYFIDQLIFNDQNASKEVTNNVIQQVQETIQQSTHNQRYSSNGNEIFMIANYLLRKNNSQYDVEAKTIYDFYQFLHQQSNNNVQLLFQLLENNLDISLNYFDKVFILLTQLINSKEESLTMGGLIVAHGYATASSISSVANRLLDTHVYDSFDMPLDIRVEELIEKVKTYIENNSYKEGLLLLVDMGSLPNIGGQFAQCIESPIVLFNNVSTELALAGGELIKNGTSIIEISKNLKKLGKINGQIIYPEKKRSQMIIVSCSTGYGTALRLKELFEKTFPKESKISFLAYDFEQIKREGVDSEFWKIHEVLAIVGTENPYLEDIQFISIEDLFSTNDNRLLEIVEKHTDKEISKIVGEELIKNLSLNKIIDSLTILDSTKVIAQIEPCLSLLERSLNQKLNNNQKINLYVHVSCMIERLIRNQQVNTFPKDHTFMKHKERITTIIKIAFQSIEQLYNISIPEEEIYYIYTITQNYL